MITANPLVKTVGRVLIGVAILAVAILLTSMTAAADSPVENDIKNYIKQEQPALTDEGVDTVFGEQGTSEERKQLNDARLRKANPPTLLELMEKELINLYDSKETHLPREMRR